MIDTALYRASFSIPNRLHVDEFSFDGESVTIRASTDDLPARCPLCGRPSRRIHGCYTRTLADLPWCGTPVRLRVRVRKFFCDEPTCERGIFAERLEKVAGVHARGTDRRREALEWIAFALGGEAGARLARELSLLVSPDTLLNRIRGAFRGDAEKVCVVGVDDFGFKRGNAPGTVLVDLERHWVVDLFEGHSAESIARWLGQYPGVEVVSCDRSPVCREGVNAGAPKAMQVADRWHLLHGLTQALEGFLLRKRPVLREAISGPGYEWKLAMRGASASRRTEGSPCGWRAAPTPSRPRPRIPATRRWSSMRAQPRRLAPTPKRPPSRRGLLRSGGGDRVPGE